MATRTMFIASRTVRVCPPVWRSVIPKRNVQCACGHHAIVVRGNELEFGGRHLQRNVINSRRVDGDHHAVVTFNQSAHRRRAEDQSQRAVERGWLDGRMDDRIQSRRVSAAGINGDSVDGIHGLAFPIKVHISKIILLLLPARAAAAGPAFPSRRRAICRARSGWPKWCGHFEPARPAPDRASARRRAR